ncbi:MAG TPA: isochorismate synthase [Cytophagaceae bacterium]|jgi:isochorismate synthase|nr:isochorismate synthase [Cytophagaceae bacterium]
MRNSVKYSNVEWVNYNKEEIAFAFISSASEMNISYAWWKLPNSPDFFVLVDFAVSIQKKKAQLEKSVQGFVIQPFIQLDDNDTFFLNTDILYSTKEHEISVRADLEDIILKEKFLENVSEKLRKGTMEVSFPFNAEKEHSGKTAIQYKEMVNKAKEEIRENKFKKIVLARSKDIDVQTNGTIFSVVHKISVQYPNAFVSLFYTRETGAWLTATPEILASIDENGIFRTIALAGTQVCKEDSIQNAVWTQKEIEEQALVCRYIINCFKKIRLREYEENGPRTVQSGNLLHLRTDFTVNTVELNFPELGTVMLELLHPTSAVCGMPKEVTLAFIKEHENLERKLFSGYLGPVNINSESHIFVNLRCANIFSTKVVLYAGAGITQDSDPEKEYKETEVKMEAVGRFFTV